MTVSVSCSSSQPLFCIVLSLKAFYIVSGYVFKTQIGKQSQDISMKIRKKF